jgi:hypothetical protein
MTGKVLVSDNSGWRLTPGSFAVSAYGFATETQAGENVDGEDQLAYQYSSNWMLGNQWQKYKGTAWRTFSFESIVSNVNGDQYVVPGRAESNSAASGVTILGDLYQVQCTQTRLVSISPSAGSVSLAQATNNNRSCIVPNGWLGNSMAFNTEAPEASMSAAVAVGTGAWFACGVLQPTKTDSYPSGNPVNIFTLTGSTAAISLTAVQAAAGDRYHGQWGWSFKNDAGTTTSGTFANSRLPSVPVAVGLYYDGSSNLSLWVDGVQVGSNAAVSGTTTLTGCSISGGDARLAWVQKLISLGAKTAPQIATLRLTMRNVAGLPAAWKLVIHSGQSNSVSYGTINQRARGSAPFVLGSAWSMREYDTKDGSADTPWQSYPFNKFLNFGGTTNIYYGPGASFLDEATANGSYGWVVVSTGVGGTPIEQWLSGNPEQMHIAAVVPQAVADLGTTLIYYAGFTFVQGEANASGGTSYPGGYLQAQIDLAAWMQTTFGNGTPANVVIHRLNSYFNNNNSPYASPATIDAAQDAFVATNPSLFFESRLDIQATSPYFDGIHYPVGYGRTALGRNLFRALKGLALITDPSTLQ